MDEYQSMIFSSEDDGPIGLSEMERQSSKYDRDTGKRKTVKYKMAELVKILNDEKNIVVKDNLKKVQ